MFENYKATPEDLKAIEEGIKTVWQSEMNFIFYKKSLIEKTVVITYDSKFLYLWLKRKFPRLEAMTSRLKNYYAYKIPHKIRIQDEWQIGWQASLTIKPFVNLLPTELQKSDFKIPKISGGLLRPFFELQKKKEVKDNPYVTRESFLGTIVHEFGHVYWSQHKLWWYSNKKENINYLRTAKRLYEKKETISKIPLYLPLNLGVGELFAFCAEYWASKLFWPNHIKNLDAFIENRLKELIKMEKKKDLEREDSVLEPSRNPHDFAFVFGKIILTLYPKSWVQTLTHHPSL